MITATLVNTQDTESFWLVILLAQPTSQTENGQHKYVARQCSFLSDFCLTMTSHYISFSNSTSHWFNNAIKSKKTQQHKFFMCQMSFLQRNNQRECNDTGERQNAETELNEEINEVRRCIYKTCMQVSNKKTRTYIYCTACNLPKCLTLIRISKYFFG